MYCLLWLIIKWFLLVLITHITPSFHSRIWMNVDSTNNQQIHNNTCNYCFHPNQSVQSTSNSTIQYSHLAVICGHSSIYFVNNWEDSYPNSTRVWFLRLNCRHLWHFGVPSVQNFLHNSVLPLSVTQLSPDGPNRRQTEHWHNFLRRLFAATPSWLSLMRFCITGHAHVHPFIISSIAR